MNDINQNLYMHMTNTLCDISADGCRMKINFL